MKLITPVLLGAMFGFFIAYGLKHVLVAYPLAGEKVCSLYEASKK